MADIKKVSIPPVPPGDDQDLNRFLSSVKQMVEILDGTRAGILDRCPRWVELRDAGIALQNPDGKTFYHPDATGSSGASSSASRTSEAINFSAIATLDATSGLAEGTHLLDSQLPTNAYVTRAWYEVSTTFTSATDAATIGLGIETDAPTGIVSPLAISAGGNIWDSGLHEGSQDGTTNAFPTKTTGFRSLQAVVAGGEALTDGKLKLFVEYVVI